MRCFHCLFVWQETYHKLNTFWQIIGCKKLSPINETEVSGELFNSILFLVFCTTLYNAIYTISTQLCVICLILACLENYYNALYFCCLNQNKKVFVVFHTKERYLLFNRYANSTLVKNSFFSNTMWCVPFLIWQRTRLPQTKLLFTYQLTHQVNWELNNLIWTIYRKFTTWWSNNQTV